MSRDELIGLIARLQAGLAELSGVEAKRAQREMPADVLETLRNYLNALRAEGIVEPTSERIRSPATRWRITICAHSPTGRTTLPR